MNKTFNKKRQILYLLIALIGLILIILGIVPLIKQNIYFKNADKVEAKIINILDYPDANTDTYDKDLEYYNQLLKEYRELGIIKSDTRVAIIIEYTHNDKTFTTELGYFSQQLKIAQRINIYVNKTDSTDFIVEGRNQFGVIVTITLGSILILASLIMLFVSSHNSKINLKLLKDGNVIEAEVLYVDMNERKESFGRHPNLFTCVYKNEETGKEEYFTSDSVYSKNPGSTYIGKKVNVYIDPNDNKNYYVDTEKFEKE